MRQMRIGSRSFPLSSSGQAVYKKHMAIGRIGISILFGRIVVWFAVLPSVLEQRYIILIDFLGFLRENSGFAFQCY